MTILSTVPLYPVVTPQALSVGGIAPTYAAAPTGLTWRMNDGAVFMHVKNGGGASLTVTVPRVDPLPDLALIVPAGSERFLNLSPHLENGAISAASAANPATAGILGLYSDYANASFSVLTSVTYALFSLPLQRGLRRNSTIVTGGNAVVGGTNPLVVWPLDAWIAFGTGYLNADVSGHHLSGSGLQSGIGPTQRSFAHVRNAGGAPTSVTIQVRGGNWLNGSWVWGSLVNAPNTPIIVPAGGERLWTFPTVEQFPVDIRTAEAWYVVLTYSVTASVTVAAFDLRTGWGDQ